MSDIKNLIDEYTRENQLLRSALQETQTALVLAVAHTATQGKNGAITLAVPAKARNLAKQINDLDLGWSNPDEYLTKGSLRLKGTLVKDTDNDND